MSRHQRAFDSVLNVLDADFKESLCVQEQLQLYGWFKVARSEPVKALLSVTGTAKYKAYQSVQHLSPEEAMIQYIEFVRSKASSSEIAETCDAALWTLRNNNDPTPSPSIQETPLIQERPFVQETPHETPPVYNHLQEWIASYIPKPMVPRGQLDTSLSDLLYAISCCVQSPKVGNCNILRDDSIYGLSVRSLLDLYLSVKTFPIDSEIIMSPAISIPGMLDIIRYHGVNIVPVDLPNENTVAVHLPGIEDKINEKTVAIMIVNVFGNECADTQQRQALKRLAQRHKLELLEDAAESFTGILPDDCADVSFVSFGLIKTSTALCGGVAVIRDNDLAQRMRRRQETYEIQSRWEYACRIGKALLLHGILSSHYLYGFLHDVIGTVWDFDAVVYRCQRSFPSNMTMADIRKRPSSALLQMMHRCIHLKATTSTVARRIAWAEQFDTLGSYQRPIFTSRCTHWLYPVLKDSSCDLNRMSHSLRHVKRVDVTRGTLIAVDDTVPLTNQLMDRLLYLPVNLAFDRLQSGPPPLHWAYVYATVLCCFVLVWLLRGPLLCVVKLLLCFSFISFFIGWVLQRVTGRHYIQSSSVFAEFSFLFDKEARRSPKHPALNTIDTMPQLALPQHQTESRSMILTGCTGFLGSMILRDLLFYRKELKVDRIVLLCRSKRGISANERVEVLLKTTMFSFLDQIPPQDLVQVVDVDLTGDLSGLYANNEGLFRNATHLIHCAASVSFTQSLRDAAASNISSALNLQQLVASISNNVKFVHISTAFIRGKRPSDFLHDEKLCPFGPFDPYSIYKSMLGSQYQAAKAMDELGFVNTYTFSKSVCEHLLVRRNPDIIIIRPSIVGPAIESPFEGWYGRFPSTLIAAACLFFRFQWNVWSFGACEVPCIPVDILSRFIISKAMQDFSDGESSGSSTDDTDSFDKVSEFSLASSGHRTESNDSPFPRASTIFNAAWDHKSLARSQFMWSDYAAGVAQSGSVLDHFNRLRATVALYAATVLIPTSCLSDKQFETLHKVVVMFPLKCVAWVASNFEASLDLRQLRTLSMLPLLFAPFSGSVYKFHSSLFPPEHYCGRRYLASCVSAADHYINKRTAVGGNRRLKLHAFAGREITSGDSDLWWALTQPSGTIVCRIVAFVLRFILRRSFNSVTVDLLSFSCIQQFNEADRIIFAPTHRSFFDFLIFFFLCFAVPELHLGWPYAAAAKEFEGIAIIGPLMRALGAFFVQRGRLDPMLAEKIPRGTGCPRYLVFIEGTRSRDGRLGKPKTGVLRCLHENDKTVVIPIGISHEKIAEQHAFGCQSTCIATATMSLKGLLNWLLVRSTERHTAVLTFMPGCSLRTNFVRKRSHRSFRTIHIRRKRCRLEFSRCTYTGEPGKSASHIRLPCRRIVKSP